MAHFNKNRLPWLVSLVLILGTLAIYGPVVGHDFTTYDDPLYVTENPRVQQGLTAQTVAWAFTTTRGGNWHPLTWLSHALDWQLYGAWPGGHHLTSLLLHLANTVLLFALLRRMTGALWSSAVVAALFAWHPLHVESVAWVAERKDVLSTLFGLLAIRACAAYAQARRPSRYRLALLFSGLSLLAKPMLVTLPFVLLLLDYWPLKRSPRWQRAGEAPATENPPRPLTWTRLALEKWPFFILAGASSLVTFLVQKSGGAVAAFEVMPLTDRLANALTSYVSYLRKMIWPNDLAVFYPLPDSWPAGQVAAAALLLLIVTAIVVVRRQRQPYLFVGWFWFLGTLVPVIGFVQVGLQSMADRYTYIPQTGIFILLVWGVAEMAERWPPGLRAALKVATALALAGCLTLTAFHVRRWQNAETLFTHALAVSSDRFAAHSNLARALGKLGRIEEAAAHFQAALQLQPDAPLPLYNLGLIAVRRGDLQSAMEHYQAALRTRPDYAPARFELANILANQGKLEEAVNQYRECLCTERGVAQIHLNLGIVLAKLGALGDAANQFKAALRLEPDAAETHDQLGTVLQKLMQTESAVWHYSQAVRLKPELIHARLQLGLLLAQQASFEQAKEHFTAVLRLDPTNSVAHYNLGAVFAAQGQPDKAAEEFAEVTRLNPTDADARGRLASVLAQAGKAAAALPHLREALRLQPDWVEGLRMLATLLATHPSSELRNGAEAVRLAERACDLTGHRDPRPLAALAAAYAEVGEFEKAIETAQAVQQLTLASQQEDLARQAAQRLELYRAGKPCRE